MEDFETLLTREIVTSLTNHPEQWNLCIVGIKRDDGLELSLGLFRSNPLVSVYRPNKYEFINFDNRLKIFDLAEKIKEKRTNEIKAKETLNSESKLRDFLNLDKYDLVQSRKDKIEHLNDIAENDTVKIETDFLPKKGFLNKLKSLFK